MPVFVVQVTRKTGLMSYDGVMAMMIKTVFNKRFHSHMRRYCKVVAEGNGEVIYMAISNVKVDAADLAMTPREFSRLAKEITVEDGRKIRVGTVLLLKPLRRRKLHVRLSDEEYMLLREYADEHGLKMSAAFREVLIKILWPAWRGG